MSETDGGVRRHVSRRTLLLGGTAAGWARPESAVAARDDLKRLWWRVPGVDQPREEGAVDYPGRGVGGGLGGQLAAGRPARTTTRWTGW